jgi:hypothetical protein
METERITLSQRERDRLQMLHDVRQKHLSQAAAAERLKVTDRQVRRMLLRMPLVLCQGMLSCRNYGAIWIETQLLCVEQAAALNLKSLLNQKTPSQLGSLAASGCGELPLWAKVRNSARSRSRTTAQAAKRWTQEVAECQPAMAEFELETKRLAPGKTGRSKTARWIGVDDRE